jgi:hypothetical protein
VARIPGCAAVCRGVGGASLVPYQGPERACDRVAVEIQVADFLLDNAQLLA